MTPTITLDGSFIACGYVPSRTELELAIDRREQAMALSRRGHEQYPQQRSWR